MYIVRNYEKWDLEQIREINELIWLSIRWNGAYHDKDIFVAVNEENSVQAVLALSYDGTWYYIDKEERNLPLYRMQIDFDAKRGCKEERELKRSLLKLAKERLLEYKQEYPYKKIAMRCWCKETDSEEMQLLLEEGFFANNIMWVLAFDLTKEIPAFDLPAEIMIGKHEFQNGGMKDYMTANALGFDGVQDSEDELWFRLGGDTTVVFTAKDKEKVVASTTVWAIGGGRSATENIFTIPEYRRKNIGRETVCYALRYLKEKGETLATLSCLGDNLPAIAMYLSLGYKVKEHMIEMHYTI